MKFKKLICGVVTGALLLTTCTVGYYARDVKADTDLTKNRVAWIDFDDSTYTNKTSGGAQPSPITTGMASYEGEVSYADGNGGSGKALKISDASNYGIKLNQNALGKQFTVSFWVKPDGTLRGNGGMCFMGYHSPDNWVSVAGENGSQKLKIWGLGGAYSTHTQFGSKEISEGSWHNVVVTGQDTTVNYWVDGSKVSSGKLNNLLVSEESDILFGSNNWDNPVDAAIDDVMVYNRVLTDNEIAFIKAGGKTTVADFFDETGFRTWDVSVQKGKTAQTKLMYGSDVVKAENPTVSYKVSNTAIATIDADGVVTGKKAGTTTVEVSVKLGDVSKTENFNVVVSDDQFDTGRIAYYDFNESSLVNKGTNGGTASKKYKGSEWGILDYASEAVFVDSKDEEAGKALKLSGYGLKLNTPSVGPEFSVAYWMKTDVTNYAENRNVIALGRPYADGQCWNALSGEKGSTATVNKLKFWGNGGKIPTHTTVATADLTPGEWHYIVITGKEDDLTLYIDNNKIGSAKEKKVAFNNPLLDADEDVYIGVNHWDTMFDGLVDDVMVYNRVLTDAEMVSLYTGDTPENLLKKEGLELEDVSVMIGAEATPAIKINAAAKDAAEMKYEIADEAIAKYDAETGKISGLKRGTTTFTVTATIGSTTKTDTCQIKVKDIEDFKIAAFDFDKESLGNSVAGGAEATAIVTGLANYAGDVAYEEDGPSGNGNALVVGNYGLRLNTKDVGQNYTVSVWMKRDGNIANNQAVLFTGHHDPENWVGFAGEDGTNVLKVWARDTVNGTGLAWTKINDSSIGMSEGWHHLVLTGSESGLKAYMDGILVGSSELNPKNLVGENQDIYVGVNNWDNEFNGLVDDIEVYDIELTKEQILELNGDLYEKAVDRWLDEGITEEQILGKNASLDEIKYDLSLPAKVNGQTITWTSSMPKYMSNAGKYIKYPTKDSICIITAEMTVNDITAMKQFMITLKALDKTELNALIKKVEAADKSELDEGLVANIDAVLKEAKAADNFEKVDTAVRKLKTILAMIAYNGSEDNPFIYIDHEMSEINMSVNDAKTLITIPEAIQDYVLVEYVSGKNSLVDYKDGVAYAKAEGRAIVTAKVTSLYDGWEMDYSNAIQVGSGIESDNPAVKAIVDSQNSSREKINALKEGTSKEPVKVGVQQAADDTTVVVETYVKGKVKNRTIDVKGSKETSKYEITLNAGTKYNLDTLTENVIVTSKNGKEKLRKNVKGTFEITEDSLGKIKKNGLKSASASLSKTGVLKVNTVKNTPRYDFKVKCTCPNGCHSYEIKVHVENVEFKKDIKKITLDSTVADLSTQTTQIRLTEVTGDYNSNIISSMWIVNVGAGEKQCATYEISPDGRYVTIKPILGRKGTVKITANVNGKKYNTSLKVVAGVKKK